MKILMSMSITTLFLWLFLVVAMSCIINLGCFSYGEINGGMNCRENERDALLKIKNALKDPSHRLASWAVDAADHAADCCNWYGVMCDNTTGHVLELQLRDFSYFDELLYSDTQESFGGKISHSLHNLTHLRYLDLSNNAFEGIQIPKFLGSIESLKYLNLSYSGFGGHIPPQLGNLINLLYLNLKSSYSSSSSEDVHWLSGLSSLQFLDMSGVNLSKSLNWFEVINTLPSLQELHLSRCHLSSPPLILNLNLSLSLFVLDLSINDLSESIFTWGSHLKNLKSLNLADSYFLGSNIPPEFRNMSTSLTKLDLSGNGFSSSIPNWLYNFANLELLNLVGNGFQGQISDTIQNMTSLVTLDLSNNDQFFGGVPASFRNLCNLRILSLESVNLRQNVSQFFENLLGCGSNGLESLHLDICQLGNWVSKDLGQFKNLAFLDLSSNAISGPFPTSLVELESLIFLSLSNNKLSGDLPTNLENLKKLEKLDIQGNSISGSVPTSLGQLRTLKVIRFSSNKLNGTLPENFGRLSNLGIAEINGNAMEGDISEIHFANLSSLERFDADGNKLNLKVGPIWIPPPPLRELGLGSWNVDFELPTWLPSLKNLESLNLSNCGISTSSIPGWFWSWSSQLHILSLSHNNIQGMLPNNITLPPVTDLSSNNFQGSLPHHVGTFLSELDLSNNSFSGSISNFLCRSMNFSTYLHNMENNILDREIPNCWNRWGNLVVVRLSNNKFNGSIPESIVSLSALELLHLHNNNLSGEVPFSLRDCTRLITLDIGGNKLEGNIPSWIGEKLLNLVILDLGRNSFSGKIPKKICYVTSLHILDFSNNNLFGTIPRCVSNFSVMTNVNESTGFVRVSFVSIQYIPVIYDTVQSPIDHAHMSFDTMLIPMKGAMYEYNNILGFVKSMDLSSNRLSREIPEEITHLKGLQSLNLSNNSLSGRIPKNIGSMTLIESVDFSSNQLIGKIPSSISKLTFLSRLNLSHNKLVGRIPSSTQIQSLDSSCFIGNELCGKPLTDNCSSDDTVSPPSNKENGNSHDFQIEWLYVTVTLGFIVGFWGVVGPLLLNRNWRLTYFRFLQRVEDKIYIW